MKKFFLTAVALIGLINCAISQNNFLADSIMQKAFNENGFDEPDKYFEKFSNFSVDGKYYSGDSLKNKITVISFWFEGCAPCIAEFDALNKLYDRFKSNKNFQFLSFTFEEKQEASKIADRYKLRYPIICVSRNEIYQLIFNLGFPTTIITDRTGQIKFIKSGGQENEKAANKEVDSLYFKKIEKLLSEN
jgi:thiol-disulfide isomerase/thioredoxin